MEQKHFWASKRLSQQIGAVAKYENCSEDSLVRLILEKTFNEIWKEKGSEIESMLHGLKHFDQHLR